MRAEMDPAVRAGPPLSFMFPRLSNRGASTARERRLGACRHGGVKRRIAPALTGFSIGSTIVAMYIYGARHAGRQMGLRVENPFRGEGARACAHAPRKLL